MFRVVLAAATLCLAAAAAPPSKPNVMLMFTDDQDVELGGWKPMVQTQELIQKKGAFASQWRIHTPICGPSRAEIQSGRYFHNIASKALTPPSCLGGGRDANGGACLGSGAVGQVDLGNKVWPNIFTKQLR